MKNRNYKNTEIDGHSSRGYTFEVNGLFKYAHTLWQAKMIIDNYERDSKGLVRFRSKGEWQTGSINWSHRLYLAKIETTYRSKRFNLGGYSIQELELLARIQKSNKEVA